MTRNLIGWILIFVALGFFVYGVSWGIYSLTQSTAISEGLDAAITSINAILLTNLGAVLGFSIANRNSALARTVLIGDNQSSDRDVDPPINSREQIQLIAVIVYLISLIACFIIWAVKDFSTKPEDMTVPFVIQSAKMFIGVVTAYLAFVLGVQST